MRKIMKAVQIAACTILLALVTFAILAAPGFLSDASSIVPVATTKGDAR